MATASKLSPSAASSEDIRKLINGSLVELRAAIKEQAEKFFPNGIELIFVQVKVGVIDVTLKVAGPKAAALLADTELEPEQGI